MSALAFELAAALQRLDRAHMSMTASTYNGRCETEEAQRKVDRLRQLIAEAAAEPDLSAAVDGIAAAEAALCRARYAYPAKGECAVRAAIDVELENLRRSRQHILSARAVATGADPVVIHRQSAGQVAEALAEPAPKEWHHPACALHVGLPCNNDCPRDYEGWGKGWPVQREGC
jgi:hypothetical protein